MSGICCLSYQNIFSLTFCSYFLLFYSYFLPFWDESAQTIFITSLTFCWQFSAGKNFCEKAKALEASQCDSDPSSRIVSTCCSNNHFSLSLADSIAQLLFQASSSISVLKAAHQLHSQCHYAPLSLACCSLDRLWARRERHCLVSDLFIEHAFPCIWSISLLWVEISLSLSLLTYK